MKFISRPLALFALAAATLQPARADLNPAMIAGDARWVVYADLNGLRDSSLGKELMTFIAANAQLPVADMQVGVDVPKFLATIGSITAYGANFSKDPSLIDGTLVVQGTADLRKIAEALLLQATIASPERATEVKDLPFPAYALNAPSAPAQKQKAAAPKLEVLIAFPTGSTVLVSKSRAQLLRARDVIAGSAPSIARTTATPLAKLLKPAAHAIVFGASVVPSEEMFPQDGPQARILQMTNAGSIAVGEDDKLTFAHAELVAASDAMAEKLMKILQGMAAMLSLAETSDKQLAEFLNSTQVGRDGNTVTLHLAYASTRLVQMAQNLRQASAPPAPRPGPSLVSGKALAEWTAEPGADPQPAGAPTALSWRTIENVALTNGALISLGRAANGGRSARFERIEITPAAGGSALVFGSNFMRTGGPRGNLQQIQFPGADGTYTLKVAYVNDPDGKAAYAVSVRNPPPAQAEGAPKSK